MLQISSHKLGEAHGARRLWLEGLKLVHSGFTPGARYHLAVEGDGDTLVLRLSPTGERVVSKKKAGEKIRPVIDINSGVLEEVFRDQRMVQVVVEVGAVRVTVHPKERARSERVTRLRAKLARGTKLAVGSMCSGAGILDHALHTGLADRGIATRLAWAIEVEMAYIQASLDNNPVWDDESTAVHSRAEDVDTGLLEPVDILVAGLPCTGASRSGRSKNKLAFAEQHESAGAAFVAFLGIVRAVNPAAIVMENVMEYANTASMVVIRAVLADSGYKVYESQVDASLGALEDRKRLCIVAVDESLEFDPALILPTREREKALGEVLEPIGPDADAWNACAYLDEKEARDKAAGKGFRTQRVDPKATSVGVIGRHYAKWRSTEPMLAHPTDPVLRRLLTPAEHARVKTIPEYLVRDLPATTAHQCLGQSVLHCAFVAVGRALAQALVKLPQQEGLVRAREPEQLALIG